MIADDMCWKHLTKQPSKQKVTEPAIECVKIFKALFSNFSLCKLQRISKLIARNSHLALKTAIMSQCDVTSIILTKRKNRDIQGILCLLMQNYDKVIERRFLAREASR